MASIQRTDAWFKWSELEENEYFRLFISGKKSALDTVFLRKDMNNIIKQYWNSTDIGAHINQGESDAVVYVT